jgi:hypothetical protein
MCLLHLRSPRHFQKVKRTNANQIKTYLQESARNSAFNTSSMYSFLQIAKENTEATCKVFKMKAVVTQEEKKAGVVEKEIPSITSDEVLVKVVAVALNPTDCT